MPERDGLLSEVARTLGAAGGRKTFATYGAGHMAELARKKAQKQRAEKALASTTGGLAQLLRGPDLGEGAGARDGVLSTVTAPRRSIAVHAVDASWPLAWFVDDYAAMIDRPVAEPGITRDLHDRLVRGLEAAGIDVQRPGADLATISLGDIDALTDAGLWAIGMDEADIAELRMVATSTGMTLAAALAPFNITEREVHQQREAEAAGRSPARVQSLDGGHNAQLLQLLEAGPCVLQELLARLPGTTRSTLQRRLAAAESAGLVRHETGVSATGRRANLYELTEVL